MPVAWSLSVAWLLLHSTAALPGALDHALRVSDIVGLLFGNLTMIGLNAMAAVRDRGWRSIWVAALNPLYWVLHSWAAWRALIQLVRNPFLWEKTPHGLDAPTALPAGDEIVAAIPGTAVVALAESHGRAPAAMAAMAERHLRLLPRAPASCDAWRPSSSGSGGSVSRFPRRASV